MIEFETPRIVFAFGAGVVTFFAPCAYPLLPGYVAYYLGREEDAESVPRHVRIRRASIVGLLASIGFFVVYAALLGIAVVVGTRALASVTILELVVGAILVVLGSVMLARKSVTFHVPLPERRRSATGFVLFGVVYAVAAAGCTAPVFIAVALSALSAGSVAAVMTLGAYAGGMSLLMVAVTLLAALGRDTLVRRLSRQSGRLTRVAGAVLVVAGFVQLYYFLFEFGGLELLSQYGIG